MPQPSSAVAVGIDDDDPFHIGDDDDDYGDNVQSWVPVPMNAIKAKPMDAATMKNVAKNNQNVAKQLASIQKGIKDNSAIVNRHTTAKKIGKVANATRAIGTVGVGAANTLTGGAILGGATLGTTTGWAAVAVGGLSLGAGPIGLLAAATVGVIGASAMNAVSAHKTRKHIEALEFIHEYAQKGVYACSDDNSPVHAGIIHGVLPYIIKKKKAKLARRAFKAVPVIGVAESVRAKAKWLKKKLDGSQGFNRSFNANALAAHHCATECALTRAIIAELFSVDDEVAEEARYCDERALAKLIEVKIKSV